MTLISDGRILGESPHDGAPLTPVPVTPVDHLPNLVVRAREAADGWRRRSLRERYQALRAVAKKLLDDRAAIIELSMREVGKVRGDALFTEGLGPLDTVDGWYGVVKSARQGRVPLSPIKFPGKRARIELVPLGVVGIIAPWNFPVAGLYRSVWPALLLGNGIVVKPSEYSPRSSGWFLEHLARELPEGLVGIAQGDGAVGSALINAGVDGCVFTGSVATGRRVARACLEREIPCSTELGGNDAAIVLDDHDPVRTVASITHWALQNAGQACGAVEVVYADSRVAEQLAERLARAFSQLGSSPGLTEAQRDVAPLANRRQLELVEAHVADALAKGARVLWGGKATGAGLGFEPTVLADCTDDMLVVQEETFGPVLPVVAVDGPADAVRRVNQGKYGLTASLWTQDFTRAERLADMLDVGVVTVNNHAFTGAIAELPWAGRRDSGLGIANSVYSLTSFARPKAIVVDRSSGFEPFWAPFDEQLVEFGETLADLQLGVFGGAWKLPGLLRARAKRLSAFYRK